MSQTIQPKKLLIVNIIDILHRYTDSEHTLTQHEIERILKDEYLMSVDRKTVRRNLTDLIDCGIFEIRYKESIRKTPKMTRNKETGKMESTGEMEESAVYSDFSIARDFTEGELRYLIDGVFASRHIPAKHREDLIRKIENLGGRYFRGHSANISKEAPAVPYSSQLFYTIGVLDEAIRKQKKVKFRYRHFGLDKKTRYRLNDEGVPKDYEINPYEMIANNGRYYLVCNDGTHQGLANYRIDRIADIEMLSERAIPLKDFASKTEIDNYVNDHIYMYAGKGAKAKLKVRRRMISEMVDTFGENFRVTDVEPDEKNGWMTVSVTVNPDSLAVYAKSLAPDVIVLSPKEVADRVKNELAEALGAYQEMGR